MTEVTESPGEAQRITYYGTPGIKTLTTLADSPGRGLFFQDGRCFAVTGGTLYELTIASDASSVTVTTRGTVANDGQPVTMCSSGINGHQLFIVSGGSGYILDLNTHVLTTLTTNFPPNALMGAYLDGYFIALWEDHFQISALMDGLSWNATDTARPSITSDRLNSIVVNHRELWIFGELSTEVWYDAGTSPFPFAPVPGVLIEMGCRAPWSVTRFDNGLAWLGRNSAGGRIIVFAQQYQPQRLSTHAVEAALHSYDQVDDFRGYAYREQGHTFYVLNSAHNNATWAYDAAVPKPYGWAERGFWNSTLGQYEAQKQIEHAYVARGLHVMLAYDSGKVYQQRLGIYTDDGVPIRAMRRCPHVQPDNRRVFYSRFELGIEPGVGLAQGQGADPQLMLRWSDDGGYTWSAEQWVTAGRMGTYDTRARWLRLGSSRNRVFEVTQSDNVKRAWIWASVQAQPEAA
jgi:hypothetical protein